MRQDNHIHITGVGKAVGTILEVLLEPYGEFVKSLHAAGRITDEELQSVRTEFQRRCDRLPDLVDERQQADASRPPTETPDAPSSD